MKNEAGFAVHLLSRDEGRQAKVAAVAVKISERIKVDPNGCWIWQGPKLPKGYGVISPRGLGGSSAYTHRVMCEHAHGPIPAGMQVDHLCRVPSCCNPAHLEIVTPSENTRRGDSPKLARARAGTLTHCRNGHAYTPENTYRTKAGIRSCRACRAVVHQELTEKRRATKRLLTESRYRAGFAL